LTLGGDVENKPITRNKAILEIETRRRPRPGSNPRLARNRPIHGRKTGRLVEPIANMGRLGGRGKARRAPGMPKLPEPAEPRPGHQAKGEPTSNRDRSHFLPGSKPLSEDGTNPPGPGGPMPIVGPSLDGTMDRRAEH
jgi:hypothetical protein